MKSTGEFSGKKKSGEWASGQKKRHDRKSNGSRQKNKRGDSKKESNDSPEIPDRGETLDIPGLPSGDSDSDSMQMSIKVNFSVMYRETPPVALPPGEPLVIPERFKKN